jgi:uncharacterized protein
MTRSKTIGEFAMTEGGRPYGLRSLSAAFPTLVLFLFIQLYRWMLSPALTFWFGATSGCRFSPTCSQYAREAIKRHGTLTGSALAVKRICRCHPFGGCGHDPVPEMRAEGLISLAQQRGLAMVLPGSDACSMIEGEVSHG